MATGISAKEQHSVDALTAHIPHRDPHALPSGKIEPFLSYDNRLGETEALEPLPASFLRLEGSQWQNASLEPEDPEAIRQHLQRLEQRAEGGWRAGRSYP